MTEALDSARPPPVGEPAPRDRPAERQVLSGLFEPEGLARLGGFRPFRPGVEILPLYGGGEDAAGNAASAALLRYAPGASVPRHVHDGYETVIVLAGAQADAHGRYERGTCLIHHPGSQHAVSSESGCVVLVTWSRPVRFLEDETEPLESMPPSGGQEAPP